MRFGKKKTGEENVSSARNAGEHPPGTGRLWRHGDEPGSLLTT